MSRSATSSTSDSSGVTPTRFTRNLEVTASSWRTCPNANARKNVPNVDGARPALSSPSPTEPNEGISPLARIRSVNAQDVNWMDSTGRRGVPGHDLLGEDVDDER